MRPSRISFAVALLSLGLVAGLATCNLAPQDPGDRAEVVAVSSLGFEIFLGFAALAGGALSATPLRSRLGLGPGRLPWGPLLLLVAGMVALSHGLDGVLQLSGLREHSTLAEFEATLSGIRGRAAVLALLGVGIAPGIAEELLCRGLVQRGLERRIGPRAAIVAAALVFGALHVDPIHAAFAAVLGLYLGAAAFLGGGVRAPIACHATNNVLAVATVAWLPGLELTTPGSTLLGFGVATGCLATVWRRRAPDSSELAALAPGWNRLPETTSEPGRQPALQQHPGSDDS